MNTFRVNPHQVWHHFLSLYCNLIYILCNSRTWSVQLTSFQGIHTGVQPLPQPPAGDYLGCFCFLALMNNGAINMNTSSGWTFSLQCPTETLCDHFRGAPGLFSKQSHCRHSHHQCLGFWFSYVVTNIFESNSPSRCELITSSFFPHYHF
jgi:hypothetical protein